MRTHLPVDALAHLTLPLLEGLSYAPLINSTLLPDLPALPSDEIMTNAYRALKRRAQSLMLEHWRSLPLPDYYPYPLHLSPHPFMGLGKFMAGRIHQMRSQKSYQAAHPSWFNAHDSSLCPHCGDALEVASSCCGIGVTAEDGMAERLGLVSTEGAERGVVSIKPGGVGSQVTFLRALLVDTSCHKLP